jgi:tungstate transport system ATP-binding protein
MPDACSPLVTRRVESLLPLEVEALGFSAGEEKLLDGIDLTIESAGISVIMGPNGAGKSLFLRLVHGMLTPTCGEIRWRRKPLDTATRRHQALVFQKPVLMRRSVAANLDFVLKPRGRGYRERRDQLLRQAGLFAQRDRPARLLSGGEQQKLALARALATEPAVLMLDEPCASIDAASTQQIEDRLLQVRRRGVKIVLVTHDIGQARRLADDVVFMHHGRVLEYCAAAAFFDAPSCPEAKAYLEGRIVI